jgi:hypothetical protein
MPFGFMVNYACNTGMLAVEGAGLPTMEGCKNLGTGYEEWTARAKETTGRLLSSQAKR